MKSTREINEDRLIFNKAGTLSSTEFICVVMNTIIGTGVLKLGSAFNSGIIFTHLLNIFVAFISVYSIKLYVLAAAFYHESTFEEIWGVAFSQKTSFIPAICSILSSFTNVMSYLSYLQSSSVQILSMLILLVDEEAVETVETIERYSLLIGLFIMIAFVYLHAHHTICKYVVVLSIISLSLFGIVFVYIIGRFIQIVQNDGFNSQHRLKLFDLKDNISNSITSLTYAYLFYPFAWPGLRHSKNPTVKNLSKTFYLTIFITYVIYSIVGTISYFSFFNLNTGGIILNYYKSDTKINKALMLASHLVTFFYIMFTIPVVLNPSRYVILNFINKRESFPIEIWALMGLTLSLISFLLGNFPGNIVDIIFCIADILTLSLLFFFPSILYLKGYGMTNKWHFFGAIGEIILGIVAISFMLYLDFC